MTNEERRDTALWMSEQGIDKLKGDLLQKTLAYFHGVLKDAPIYIQDLMGEVANTALLEYFNWVRKQGQDIAE